MNIDEQKKSLRKTVKALKNQLSEPERAIKSKIICEKITQNPVFQNAKTVMLYWSMQDEVATHDLVIQTATTKKVILPSVDRDLLVLKEFQGVNDLKKGDLFEILEPSGKPFSAIETIDVIIVPGVAFDIHNRRMGRGKAYYDKTLLNSKAYKIGICFDFQLFEEIPCDRFDVKMDLVISDKI